MRDAVVVGAGPNGLAAATLLALHGLDVLVVEASDTPGGGLRSAELTLPGFAHDVCSAVHPMAVGSPFLSRLPLERHGLDWVHAPAPLAHALDDGRAAVLHRSMEETGAGLGADAGAWTRLVGDLASGWWALTGDVLAPLLRWPRRPLRMARLGGRALRSASALAQANFATEEARALLAGCAAHSLLPLDRSPSAGVGIVLAATGHAVGWPIPRGGSGRLAGALIGHLRDLGAEIHTGWTVARLAELPQARAILLDLTPRQVVEVAGRALPERYARSLRDYRYGPGAFKVDWALAGSVPWRAPGCALAATVHLGGHLDEIAASEAAPWHGRISDRPFVLFSEPSRFDPTRAPPGRGVAWGYCHVPHAWAGDPGPVLEAVEAQVERFAPGFRDLVLARSVRGPAELEAGNPNLVGGDINGGVQDLVQLFRRPILSPHPYRTPVEGLYLCSASTPPGGGVHGMCGYHAARAALHHSFGIRVARHWDARRPAGRP